VKSCINVKGFPVTCASKTLENYKGAYDADVIVNIKKEDGIIIGMANMDEFACGVSGETSAFGPTKNPASLDLIPGGTSSGSAAGVAANFCDMALGSDTGGSIRNPASHCGVIGIKPSYGRVSRYGLVDMAMSFDQIGPLAKNIEDASLLLEVISGYSQNDGASIMTRKPKYKKDKSKLKVGILSTFDEMCSDKEIAQLVNEATLNFIAKTKSTKIEVELKHVDLAIQTYYPLVYVEFFSGTRKFDGRKYGKKIEDHCGEEVLRRILGGREISKAEHHGKYYRKALQARNIITNEINNSFQKVDVIMLPTTPKLPHKLNTKITDPRVNYAYDAFTIPSNLAGCCAGVVPIGDVDGAPVGLQIMAPAFKEDVLLNAMRVVESEQAL